MEQVLNINRFGNLLWRSQVQNKQVYIRLSIICCAVFVMLGFINVVLGTGNMGLYTVMINVMIVLAPVAFFFRRRTHTSHLYEFTLPASVLEKFLVKLLNCTLILPMIIIALSYILIGIFKVIPHDAISGIAEQSYALMNEETIAGYWSLIVFQSVFLCGSYFFKDSAFIKTILVLLGILFVIFLIALIYVFSLFDFFSGDFQFNNIGTSVVKNENTFDKGIIKYIIYYFMPLGLWFASFLKLKETEI